MKLPRLSTLASALGIGRPAEGGSAVALAVADNRPRTGTLGLAALLNEQALDELTDLLTRLPDPDLVLQQAGIARADLRRLEGDDEIAAALETRREAVIATPWRLEPWKDSPVSAWIWDEIEPHLDDLARGAWQAIPYGYSVIEVVYRALGGGRLGIARLAEKPLEWFSPQRDGGLVYHGTTGAEERVDTAEKFLLTRRLPTYRNPYGEALLSRLYWPWYFRTNGWQFWARFLERHGAPLLVGKSRNTTAMLDALMRSVQSAVVSVDRDDEVTAVASANAGTAFSLFSQAVDRRVQKVILGQTLTTDVSGTGGSFAAAKVHDNVRDDRRLADCALIANTVQRLVDALSRRNFPAAEPPTFVFADQTGLELERADRDAKLVQAGVLTLTDQYLLDRYDFEAGDFIAGGSAAPAPRLLGRSGAFAATAHLAVPAGALLAAPPGGPGRFSPGQMAAEGLIDATLARAASPIPAARLRAVIAAARDPEDLTARLAKLYGETQGRDVDTSAFRELAERALFTADILGYHNAEVGED